MGISKIKSLGEIMFIIFILSFAHYFPKPLGLIMVTIGSFCVGFAIGRRDRYKLKLEEYQSRENKGAI